MAYDWSTFNQTNISEFVKELKAYYGSPLTKEKIAHKVFDSSDDNAWRHETGSSIIEMIDLSEKFYNQSDFDKILDDILNYYDQRNNHV